MRSWMSTFTPGLALASDNIALKTSRDVDHLGGGDHISIELSVDKTAQLRLLFNLLKDKAAMLRSETISTQRKEWQEKTRAPMMLPGLNSSTSSTAETHNVSVEYQYIVRQFMPHEALLTYNFICVIISEVVSTVGVVTNIINIIVFVKLGLRETTSISMMSLAVSDLILSALGLWSNLISVPRFINFGLPIRSGRMVGDIEVARVKNLLNEPQ
ncbi:hypothetical protein ElyMa_001521400 [Elysia marginata]|uniref:G-protein coupled receptors family 1 profile domain-containing protein n=1 Tax=Elysia marginata TaxID=1093978 RepID=A0AAV4J6I8_9GAST|nr:hypothetical protein ElyMa_001521400 [Elysia marginata]